jgi:hypothetical protein
MLPCVFSQHGDSGIPASIDFVLASNYFPRRMYSWRKGNKSHHDIHNCEYLLPERPFFSVMPLSG